MRAKKRKIVAIAMAMMMLTSCGNGAGSQPELVEPIAANEAYITVGRGDIGEPKIYLAKVIPMQYCHFWTTSLVVEDIKVDVGDSVKKGDVLAVADMNSVEEQKKAIQERMGFIQSVKSVTDEKYTWSKKRCEYTKKGAQKLRDTKGVAAADMQLKVLEEDQYYDDLLYKHRMAAMSSELQELAKVEENHNLIADHDGYVTYVRDLSKDQNVSKDCNVVVISDFKDSYIELPVDTKTGVNVKFDLVYSWFEGEKKELKEIEYSEKELATAKTKSIRLPSRYVFEDGTKLPEIGSTVPVIKKKESKENVICVSNSSLYDDEQGKFVYVKKGDSNEKRYVEIGASDEHSTEILSGLEEGEQIFYKSNNAMPEKYDEVKVELRDYGLTTTYKTFKTEDKKTKVKKFEGNGILESMAMQGSKVKKGEEVATISVTDGGAMLTQIQMQISNCKIQYDASCKGMNQQIADIEKQIKQFEKLQRAKEKEATQKMQNDADSSKKEEKAIPSKPEKNEDISEEALPINMEIDEQEVAKTSVSENEQQQEVTTQDENGQQAAEEEQVTTQQEQTQEVPQESTTQEIVTTQDSTQASTQQEVTIQNSTTEAKKTETATQQPAKKEEKQPPMSPYIIEELKSQIQELECDKRLQTLYYNNEVAGMEKQIEEMKKNNNGNGKAILLAEEDCEIKTVYHATGDEVKYGEPLFAFGVKAREKMLLRTEDLLGLNEKIEFMTEDKVKYTGTVMANLSDTTNYITVKNDVPYLTNSEPVAQASYYVISDDKELYSDQTLTDARGYTLFMHDIFVVPANSVYQENIKGDDYYYVWKVVDGGLVKQYVTGDFERIDSNGAVYVTTGLTANDVVALKKK